jgi:hypothetical protein
MHVVIIKGIKMALAACFSRLARKHKRIGTPHAKLEYFEIMNSFPKNIKENFFD